MQCSCSIAVVKQHPRSQKDTDPALKSNERTPEKKKKRKKKTNTSQKEEKEQQKSNDFKSIFFCFPKMGYLYFSTSS